MMGLFIERTRRGHLPPPLEAVIQGGNSIISKTTQFITLSASRDYGAPPFDLEAASASSMYDAPIAGASSSTSIEALLGWRALSQS